MHLDLFQGSSYSPRLVRKGALTTVFDPFRQAFVAFTPEEWVRQHLLHYLVTELLYPRGVCGVEIPVVVNRRTLRADIVAYSKPRQPFLLVECKAEHVPIRREVVEQVAQYNQVLQAPYFAVSNGHEHLIFAHQDNAFLSLDHYPDFPTLSAQGQEDNL